ncbi:MAG TPA: retroviral-like aspartic protease family protein [Aliidongia sp.]|uniref:retroviral-like aspartic protease family protein n=1 Tax=Aliidongia sp. TaxID=1914230 RepID=UPI002DDCE180|nr:retroviral-like aspartic protease family protein [Aliidongia sp.]HEV2676694.1 retroviral-like aspartic protease family protein [Aliidongia sp.]
MVHRFHPLVLAILSSVPIWTAPALAEPCTLKQLASIDTERAEGRLIIPVGLDGRASRLSVDTGAPIGILRAKLVDDLGASRRTLDKGAVIDIAGVSFDQAASVHELKLGEMTARDVEFLIHRDPARDGGADGTFGANFLTAYDVEFDFGRNKMNLFLKNTCDGSAAYWSRHATKLPLRVDASLHTFVEVTLDGQLLLAMIDTGSSESILSLTRARLLFGIDPVAAKLATDGTMRSGTGEKLPFYRHRFGALALGNIEIRNTEMVLTDDRLADFYRTTRMVGDHPDWEKSLHPDLILGLHHLERLHIYLGYGKNLAYLTADGS